MLALIREFGCLMIIIWLKSWFSASLTASTWSGSDKWLWPALRSCHCQREWAGVENGRAWAVAAVEELVEDCCINVFGCFMHISWNTICLFSDCVCKFVERTLELWVIQRCLNWCLGYEVLKHVVAVLWIRCDCDKDSGVVCCVDRFFCFNKWKLSCHCVTLGHMWVLSTILVRIEEFLKWQRIVDLDKSSNSVELNGKCVIWCIL